MMFSHVCQLCVIQQLPFSFMTLAIIKGISLRSPLFELLNRVKKYSLHIQNIWEVAECFSKKIPIFRKKCSANRNLETDLLKKRYKQFRALESSIYIVSKVIPQTACLHRASAAYLLCYMKGFRAKLYLGVRREKEAMENKEEIDRVMDWRGHAWVEVDLLNTLWNKNHAFFNHSDNQYIEQLDDGYMIHLFNKDRMYHPIFSI